MGKYKYSGLFLLVIYLLYTIIFYKERTLYVDPGLQIFEMVNGENFKIYVGRFSMYINQVFPVLGIWAGLPLQYILFLYSISFAVIFLLIYWLLAFRWNQVTAGIAMVATLFLTRYVFVHSISETWLGIAYSALFFGWVSYYLPKAKKYKMIIFYLVTITIIFMNYFIHVVTLFTLAAALGWIVLHGKKWKNPHIYIIFLIIIAIYCYKFLFPYNSHEEGFFSELKLWDVLLPKLTTLPSFQFLTYHFRYIYLYPAVFIVLVSIFFIVHKKYLELVFLFGTLTVFIVINCITFHKGDSSLGMESRFLPLMFFVMLPLGKYLLETRFMNYIIFVLFCWMGLKSIYYIPKVTRHTYTARLEYIDELLNKAKDAGVQKALLQESDVDVDRLLVHYNIGVESMMYSTAILHDTRTVYICKDLNEITPDAMVNPDLFFMVPWYIYFKTEQLNSRYFRFDPVHYYYIGSHP